MDVMGSGDPVLKEIVQNALESAAEEGGLATVRAAGSQFLSSSGGIACALFDLRGRQIAQNAGGLPHVSALRLMQKELLRVFPVSEMAAGDVFIFNDHFRGGIHCADVAMFEPVFHDGAPILFVATMMIVSDMGGMSAGGLPANATEIFHEGLVIPPLRFRDAGRRRPDIEALILANVRLPAKVMGDLDALITGLSVTRARTLDLLERYGAETVLHIVDHLIDYARTMTEAGIRAIPDGVYIGEYTIEADGFDERADMTVRCTITVRDGHCAFDFTGTDRQAMGPVNCSESQSLTGVAYTLRCYLDPSIPLNEGFYDAFDASFPKGSLLNPNFPAACNLRMATVNGVILSINRALGDVFPNHLIAGQSAPMTATIGAAPGHKPWAMIEADFGSAGARNGSDGVDGTPPLLYSSPGWMRSIEGYEIEFPVEFQCFQLLPDSGGPGRWRGSTTILKRMRILEDGWLTVRLSDTFHNGAAGVEGGEPGRLSRWVLNEGREDEEILPPKKTNHFIKAGSTLSLVNGGGGGFGDPLLRDPDAVAADVRRGLVTAEGALRDYGVEVDTQGSNARRVQP